MKPLLEASFDELHKSTFKAFPDTTKRQHVVNDVRVIKTAIVKDSNGITARTETLTTSGDKHKQVLSFESPGADSLGDVDLEHVNVKLNCGCLDFRWRFAMWNSAEGALYGNPPPPYRRKTDTRPPANPSNLPGVCKHLMASMDELLKMQVNS